MPTYKAVIAFELAIQRYLDFFQPPEDPTSQQHLAQHLTAIVKTFERPKILARLINSIRRRYPGLPVIVVDDSRYPQTIPGVETIVMPYDSGVSAGRNRALENVTSEYVLLLDDDFIFYRHTRLFLAMEIMEKYPQIDIMGGQVVDLPLFKSVDYSKASIFPTSAQSTLPIGSYIAELPVYDKVANFFIARTDRLRLVSWTPEIKRLDHADFFTRAKGVLTSVYNKNLKCLHARTPYDLAYRNIRYDTEIDQAVLKIRYYRQQLLEQNKKQKDTTLKTQD